MAKLKTVYICQNCGNTSMQWTGQCANCGAWNTYIEDVVTEKVSKNSNSNRIPSQLVRLSEILSTPTQKLSTGVGEFDRVIGGGFVPGQVILLAGEPGIGKSTIITEIAKNLKETKIIYVCGEESPDQIKLRALRMGYDAQNLYMLQETNVDSIISSVQNNQDVGLVIIDSIQTLYAESLGSNSGSLVQVRGCTQILTDAAKSLKVPFVLVGHVTKEGVVAGPKVLEHIVDTVLYLEGDAQHLFRILRTNKNRFGPVSEVGIFQMEEGGMREVRNPSEMLLEQRMKNSSGSCVTVTMEGYRPLLFEIQALTTKTAFGYPRRTANGFSANRLQVLIAIIEKRAGIYLGNHDVYVSVAGGFKVSEYSADLSVCLAIISSLKDQPIKENTVAFGECGLNGEIRNVSHQQKRSDEAQKLGFSNILSPQTIRSLKDALEKAFQ